MVDASHGRLCIVNTAVAVVSAAHCILYTSVCLSGSTFYCDDKKTSVITDPSGYIRTVNEGQAHYGNNMLCKWVIDSGSPYKRVQLTVEESDLQWAPENAICNGYDYIQIRDGMYFFLNSN